MAKYSHSLTKLTESQGYLRLSWATQNWLLGGCHSMRGFHNVYHSVGASQSIMANQVVRDNLFKFLNFNLFLL